MKNVLVQHTLFRAIGGKRLFDAVGHSANWQQHHFVGKVLDMSGPLKAQATGKRPVASSR